MGETATDTLVRKDRSGEVVSGGQDALTQHKLSDMPFGKSTVSEMLGGPGRIRARHEGTDDIQVNMVQRSISEVRQ